MRTVGRRGLENFNFTDLAQRFAHNGKLFKGEFTKERTALKYKFV